MKAVRFAAGLVAMAVLAACGGPVDMTCDEVKLYQQARQGERIRVPEGLDELDPLREIPLPDASPRSERPVGSPCLDRPPAVTIGN